MISKTSASPAFPPITACNICIIGLGYVGLPLAVAFSRSIAKCSKSISKVIAFDINTHRINELCNQVDSTQETNPSDLVSDNLIFTSSETELIHGDVFIVTVPTPIDHGNNPDLSYIQSASSLIGNALKKRPPNSHHPVIIFESTVYPGATEEICIPIIESASGFQCDGNSPATSFSIGYSPERINPGDKVHTLSTIIKVVSGSTPDTADWIKSFYSQIVAAGVYVASSIKVAEASKVIENTQRDLNIALVNEFSIMFHRFGIDTSDVLQAAETKWNFMGFRPGLVGGHCIWTILF